jgi:BirA family biotin operon repressor/biotin-[acetyl-CoA-carboxylase] ligase
VEVGEEVSAASQINPREEWRLNTRHLGQLVQVYQCLPSTSTQAALLADDPRNHGRIILAEEQTAGRGQYQRTWHAPAGKAVLMSVVLFPPHALRRPALLTAWGAVSVCQTIRLATGLQARIKWPNDVLIRGRKVCGILIESKVQAFPSGASQGSSALGHFSISPAENGSIEFAVVVGIGLNINQTAQDFQEAGLSQAGSLALSTGRAFDYPTIARLLVEQLDEEYDSLIHHDLETLAAGWKWHIGLLGKEVAIEGPCGRHWGRLRDLTLDAVELEQSAGKVLHFSPESIRHIEPA